MKVNISDLQTTIFLLLEKLKENKGTEIEIKNDYFWDIPSDEIYNIDEEPKIECLGQLSFDLN